MKTKTISVENGNDPIELNRIEVYSQLDDEGRKIINKEDVNGSESTQKHHVNSDKKSPATDESGAIKINSLRANIVTIVTVVIFTYVTALHSLVISQYSYSYINKNLFPNASAPENNNSLTSCEVNRSSHSYQNRQKVQLEASKWTLYNGLAEKVPELLISIIIGSLSDRYGRKIFACITLGGEFVKIVLYAVLIYFKVDIYYFLYATFIEGITGGPPGLMTVIFAYTADVTSSTKGRLISILYIEVALGIGSSVSGLSSGYIIKATGFLYSMIIPAAINGFALIFLVIMMEESRSNKTKKDTPLLKNLSNALTFFTRDTSSTSKRWKYIICLIIFMAGSFSTFLKIPVDILYELNVPFCWTEVTIGWFTAATMFFPNFVGAFVVRVFRRFSSISIKFWAVVSCISSIASNILQACAYTDVMMFLVPVVGLLGFLTPTIMRAYMSKMSPPDKQGSLFSSLAFAHTVVTMVNDASSKYIYMKTVTFYRGLIYFVFAGYSFIALIFLTVLIIGTKMSKRLTEPIEPDKTTSI